MNSVDTKMDVNSFKCLMAMILAFMIAMVCISKNIDGDIVIYALGGILALGGLEVYFEDRVRRENAAART